MKIFDRNCINIIQLIRIKLHFSDDELKYEYRDRPFNPKKIEIENNVGLGKESNPYGRLQNDCCLLKISEAVRISKIPDPCSFRKIKINEVLSDGGKCVLNEDIQALGQRS